MSSAAVLVVEDDNSLREALCDTLQTAGIPVKAVANGSAALKLVDTERVSMVVSDVHMQPMDGYNLLQQLKDKCPSLPVVLMTAYGNVEKAVQAMREGASDYLVKPFEAEVLINMVNRYLEQEKPTSELIVADKKMMDVVALSEKVAAAEVTVMINGESGTGKEVIARHIHNCSSRRAGPFVAINCAAIPENMLEAMLFGYEKGAFTGAYQSSAGKFEQAQNGTLLLDEISEMDLGLQAKLLRVIQEREVERLGGKKMIPLNVRVLATTNRNMKKEVAEGRFREDLFYRLNVFPVSLPPLRARPKDILVLSEMFIQKYAMTPELPVLSESARRKLEMHSWPGNVRELENVMQRALILSANGIIDESDLCFESDDMDFEDVNVISISQENGLSGDLKAKEYDIILSALHDSGGSKKAAAEMLSISPRTLRYKMAKMREEGIAIPGDA